MTVKELREILSHYNDEMEIWCEDGVWAGGGGYVPGEPNIAMVEANDECKSVQALQKDPGRIKHMKTVLCFGDISNY